MQTYVSELKPPGVGLSCSLVVHGLLLAVLFWSAVRERAQQNTARGGRPGVFGAADPGRHGGGGGGGATGGGGAASGAGRGEGGDRP